MPTCRTCTQVLLGFISFVFFGTSAQGLFSPFYKLGKVPWDIKEPQPVIVSAEKQGLFTGKVYARITASLTLDHVARPAPSASYGRHTAAAGSGCGHRPWGQCNLPRSVWPPGTSGNSADGLRIERYSTVISWWVPLLHSLPRCAGDCPGSDRGRAENGQGASGSGGAACRG